MFKVFCFHDLSGARIPLAQRGAERAAQKMQNLGCRENAHIPRPVSCPASSAPTSQPFPRGVWPLCPHVPPQPLARLQPRCNVTSPTCAVPPGGFQAPTSLACTFGRERTKSFNCDGIAARPPFCRPPPAVRLRPPRGSAGWAFGLLPARQGPLKSFGACKIQRSGLAFQAKPTKSTCFRFGKMS